MADMAETIHEINPRVTPLRASFYAHLIRKYADVYNLDPRLVAAVITVESSFREKAKGDAGEVGLMQLMPEYHATRLETKKQKIAYLFHIDNNIATGTKYLAGLKEVYGPVYGDLRWVELYNTGPFRRPKSFKYTDKVIKYYKQFGGMRGTTIDASVNQRGKDYDRASYQP